MRALLKYNGQVLAPPLFGGKLTVLLVSIIVGVTTYFVIHGASQSNAEPLDGFAELKLQNGNSLFVSRFEIGVNQWRKCEDDGYCRKLNNAVYKNLNTPVTKVNWFDTQHYIAWMRHTTGHNLRLPTYDEWMKIAADHRPIEKKKLFEDPRLAWAANYDVFAQPSEKTPQIGGKFGVNELGLWDIRGNVWEWTSTQCGTDESAFLERCRSGRVVMGEHLATISDLVSDPGNASCGVGLPPANLGFRLVYDTV